MTIHSETINQILLTCSRGPFRLWRNETGAAIRPHGGVVRYGLPGSSDIIGLGPAGRFIALEVKIGSDKQNERQKNFEKTINAMGGVYAVVRSVQDAIDILSVAFPDKT